MHELQCDGSHDSKALRSSPDPHSAAVALAGSRVVQIGAARSLGHNARSIRTNNSVIDNARLFDPYHPMEGLPVPQQCVTRCVERVISINQKLCCRLGKPLVNRLAIKIRG